VIRVPSGSKPKPSAMCPIILVYAAVQISVIYGTILAIHRIQVDRQNDSCDPPQLGRYEEKFSLKRSYAALEIGGAVLVDWLSSLDRFMLLVRCFNIRNHSL
jgi:hypothetical protein